MKKNTQNKTEFIQFRVDSTVKDLAKKIANEHFDGNMSDMFRYALYHCNFSGTSDNAELDRLGNSFTRLSDDASKMLAAVHDDYINQIVYHVNAQAKSCPSPVTRQAANAAVGTTSMTRPLQRRYVNVENKKVFTNKPLLLWKHVIQQTRIFILAIFMSWPDGSMRFQLHPVRSQQKCLSRRK